MKNKIRNLLRKNAAAMLTAVMCLGTVAPVFAAGIVIEGNEVNPAPAALTKTLTMPEGTTTPDATFTFKITAVSADGVPAASSSDAMPVIGSQTIAFVSTDTGTSAEGVKNVTKSITNVLSGVAFPHAGVYVYEVEEVDSIPGYTVGGNETYTFSPAKYTLTVYVKNGDGGPYVSELTEQILVNDTSDQTSPAETKVAEMVFTNNYSKRAGGEDPTNPENHVLTISKTVAGDYADRTKYFDFTVTVAQPSGGTGAVYMAYVVDSDNELVTSTENYPTLLADSSGRDYISFTSGTALTVKLKHGQKLVFTDLHTGATYEAEESAAANYIPSAAVTVNGGTEIALSGAVNTALSTGPRLIGEDVNSAAFTNTDNRNITPTGVIINNLPYIMVLVLAAGAFAVFVAVKSRRRSRHASGRRK